jgi:hypothetical protein
MDAVIKHFHYNKQTPKKGIRDKAKKIPVFG